MARISNALGVPQHIPHMTPNGNLRDPRIISTEFPALRNSHLNVYKKSEGISRIT